MAQTSIQSLEKIAKTSEDTKKLLGKLTKLNSQIGKKDETQATKLSSLVKKVADSSFTPTFLQKFLQKPDEEGNDLATRLEKTQNDFIGSFVTLFKNREAKEAARLNIEVSKLRELQANPALTKEDIEKIVAKEKSEELAKQLEEVKEANTKSFENLVEMFKLDTSALETFSEKDQALLKENINLHGDVKKVLEDTQVPHHKQVQLLEKIVSASHEKGSLFVHDINTQEQLDKLNNYNEIEIEMAKDKMRRDNISALQDKEDKKQLLNATKAGGMGAAGGAGESDSGMGISKLETSGESDSGMGISKLETFLLGEKFLPKILKRAKLLGEKFLPKGLFKVGTGTGMITGGGGGGGLMKSINTASKLLILSKLAKNPIALFAALLGFTAYNIKKSSDFVKNLSQEEKDKIGDGILGEGFMKRSRASKEEKEKYLIEHQQKVRESLFKGHEKKLDKKTDVLMKEIEEMKRRKEEGGVTPTIVNTVQDNKSIKHETNPIFNPSVGDPMRVLFRTGISN